MVGMKREGEAQNMFFSFFIIIILLCCMTSSHLEKRLYAHGTCKVNFSELTSYKDKLLQLG